LMAMPDPQALMDTASGDGEETKEEPTAPASGNVADRAGDLPPPPPAPISIDDDEEEAVSDEVVVPEASEDSDIFQEEEGASDPFASNDLDGFNTNLEDFATDDESTDNLDTPEDGADEVPEAQPKEENSEPVVEASPPPSKLKRWINLTSLAAALALFGVGLLASAFKNEIQEWIEGRDIDGSGLRTIITVLAKHALEDLNEDGAYRMQWMDSSIKRVSDTELRMYAKVGAQLKRDLYLPVLDQYVFKQLSFSEDELDEAARYDHGTESPEKPWSALYRLSAPRHEVVFLRTSYKFTRKTPESDWELTDIRVRGEDKNFIWPEGEPVEAYGKNAYDVASDEFKKMVGGFEKESKAFLENVNTLKELAHGKVAERARIREEKRVQLMGGMSRGFRSGRHRCARSNYDYHRNA